MTRNYREIERNSDVAKVRLQLNKEGSGCTCEQFAIIAGENFSQLLIALTYTTLLLRNRK